MEFKQLFAVTGKANDTVLDSGLSSTATEKKRLLYCRAQVNEYKGNEIQGYHEKALVFGTRDTLLDYEAAGFNTDIKKPALRITEIEVGLDIPVGEKFQIGIKCGANLTYLYGFYAYEIVA